MMDPRDIFFKGNFDQYQTYTVFTERGGNRFIRLGQQLTKPSYAKPDRPYELSTEHCEWPLKRFVDLASAGKEALEVSDEYWYSDSEIETKYLTESEALGAFMIIYSYSPFPIMDVDMDTPDGTYVSMI